jgi:hemerythrin-like domain-containing protein
MTDGRPQDLVDVLVADHLVLEDLFVELERGGVTSERRRDLIDVTIAELVRHANAEEQYLYPAARRYLADGDEVANRELAEHRAAERLMNDLMSTDVEHPEFDALVARLVDRIREHIRGEEELMLAPLRAACDPETLVALGTEVISAKMLGPTRPHPSAPHRPPLNKVTAPIVSLLDHAVDAFADRPTSVDEL